MDIDNVDTLLAIAAINAVRPPPQTAFMLIDGHRVEVEETQLDGENHVVTERPGESLVSLELIDWPVMTGHPETVALATGLFDEIGAAALVTADMDGETMLVAVDVGGVYADGLGGHWDIDTLQPADPEDYAATAAMRLAA